jgi:3'(2'), 5'-bisphosphate nucleotidase
VASRSHNTPETEAFINKQKEKYPIVELISSGSSLKLCLVAEGAADVYPRLAPTMEWDTAAGQAIAQAAGKQVLDYKTGKPMLYNKENLLNEWFVVE